MNAYPRLAVLVDRRNGDHDILGHIAGVPQESVAELSALADERSLQLLGLGMRARPRCYQPAWRLVVEDTIGAEPCRLADAAEYIARLVVADVGQERAA